MKTYIKPEMKCEKIINSEIIANGLANWIDGNELTHQGVTTYVYQS